jgi:exodeoxyribonuclease V gamma subunit
MRWSATSSKTACSTTRRTGGSPTRCAQTLDERAERLAREGVLPIGLVGQASGSAQLVEELVPVRRAWLALGARFRSRAQAGRQPRLGRHRAGRLDRPPAHDGAQTVWLMQISSKVLGQEGRAARRQADRALAAPAGRLRRRHARHRLPGGARRRGRRWRRSTRDEAWPRWPNWWPVARQPGPPLPVACKTALAHAGAAAMPRAPTTAGFERAPAR